MAARGKQGQRAPRVGENEAQLAVILPKDVVRQVKRAAVENDSTMRATVLRALRDAGYQVRDEDLVDRRGRSNR